MIPACYEKARQSWLTEKVMDTDSQHMSMMQKKLLQALRGDRLQALRRVDPCPGLLEDRSIDIGRKDLDGKRRQISTRL